MNKLLKQLLAVLLSLQTSLSGISTTALAEEEYGNPPYDTTEQINEEDEETTLLTEEDDEEENVIVIEQEEETGNEVTEEELPSAETTEVPEETEVPEATEIPEVTEIPEETEIPEVTVPEEPEEQEITEEPEETEAPEVTEPEETEEPAEEEPEELLELDESEPLQLNITPKDYTSSVPILNAEYNAYLDDGHYTIRYTNNSGLPVYIVAIKDDVIWFLDREENTSGTYSKDVKFDLPAGLYEMHTGFFLFGDFYISGDFYKVVVLPAPKVVAAGDFHGFKDGSYAYIDLDAFDILGGNYDLNVGLNYDYILLNISKDEPLYDANTLNFLRYNQKDGIFRIELGNPNSYGGQGYYKDYPYGSFDLRFVAKGTGTVKNGYIFASSSSTHVDITQDIRPLELYSDDDVQYGGLSYKGQTAHIKWWFGYDYDSDIPNQSDKRFEGIDRRVTFKSGNPKILKVDANGTVTVVDLPKGSPENVVITITSVADPTVNTIRVITVYPAVDGSAKMSVSYGGQEYSKTFNWTQLKMKENGHYADVVFSIDGTGLSGIPVFFTSNDDQLRIEDPNTYEQVTSYTGYLDSEGKVHVTLVGWDGGSFTLTATTAIGKSAVITVNVDGLSHTLAGAASKDSQYFVNGKAVSGWVKYDRNTGKHVYGKDVFKGTNEPDHQCIWYADTSTKKVVVGDASLSLPDTVRKIDGKLYAFDAENGLMFYSTGGEAAEGWITIYSDQIGDAYGAYVSKTGEIQTGWVNTSTGWTYFNKDYGYTESQTFVPARSGKGMTYIDQYGEVTHGVLVVPSKTSQCIEDDDGLYRIIELGKWFWVKDGAFHTGWLYLHEDKNHNLYWDTSNKNVLEKMYFDPNDHGAMKTGKFTVNGKTYITEESMYPDFYADDYDYYETIQTINNLHYGQNYPEKYTIFNGHVIDADGALVTNKLVKIAVEMAGVFYPKYVYADGNGNPVKNTKQAVNGQTYNFDSNGWLDMLNTGLTEWIYVDENGNDKSVYYSLKNAEKPEEGFFYCRSDGRKLTSVMFYDSYGYRSAIVDAKGNLVVGGIATVRSSLIAGAMSYTHITDENGKIIRSGSSSQAQIVTVKGKSYIVDDLGTVLKNSTEPVPAITEEGGISVIVMADKNGVLVRKTFKTLSDSTHGTYKVWFDERGYIAQYTSGWLYYDGNADYYALNVNKKAYLCYQGPDSLFFIIPGKTKIPGLSGETFKTGWFGNGDSPIYLNKDGSIKTGFVKRGEDTRYVLASATGIVFTLYGDVTEIGYDDFNTLFKIGGKIFCFDPFGRMVTGWVHFEKALIVDPESNLFSGSAGGIQLYDACMYFDPKTGAALTGKKKVPAPALYNGEISLGEEDEFGNNAKRVNTAPAQKTLNFDSNGVLIRNQQTIVGGKLTEFGADGAVIADKDHWADASKEMYILKNGTVATGRKKIDGVYYYFDPATGYKVTNALRKTGSKWYYYNEFGKQATPILGESREVNLPKYMQDEWGNKAWVYFGSTNDKDLTAVWNKDGSLAKIVYYETNKPAAGECVSFGLWDHGNDDQTRKYIIGGLNGYVLDSKGLPKTGLVSGFNYLDDSANDTYSLNVSKDGSKVYTGNNLSLVKIDKKYYVMYQGVLYTRQDQVVEITDWSALPASERKSLDELAKVAGVSSTGLYVMLNKDGSVAVNTTKFCRAHIEGSYMFDEDVAGVFTSNKQGVILDLVASFYRVGKNTYVSRAVEGDFTGAWETVLPLYKVTGTDEEIFVNAMIKGNGNKVLGFYDAETMKGLTGTYSVLMSDTFLIWMKNGQPQTGNMTYTYNGYKMKFYVDPSMIGTYPLW